jgi:hypothetical protein
VRYVPDSAVIGYDVPMKPLTPSALVFLIAQGAWAQQPSTPTDTESPFLSVLAAPDTVRFGAQVPDFEVKDISGRTWRSQDLRGKFTLIYVWNTFLARDVDANPRVGRRFLDLPELQRFYEKVQNEKNIQVLAFCNDYDYTHAPEYMKQAKYTFPVIADWVLINKLLPEAQGAPRYWLVNPEGRLSSSLRAWSLGGLLFEIERFASRNSN